MQKIVKIALGSSDLFTKQSVCNVTENITCFGCIHQEFYNLEGYYYNIIFYFFQFIITGFSQFVGLGAEVQKTSIVMGLLKYNEYEATNITYFVSIGSSSAYFLLILCYFKEANQFDFLAIQLLFPFIVICTDIGNFLNRFFYDQIIVIVTIVVEFIWIISLLAIHKIKQRKEEKEQQINQTMFEAFGNNQPINCMTHSQSLIKYFPQLNKQQQTKQDIMQVLYIIFAQLILQSFLYFFRGGNKKKGLFVSISEYNSLKYWIVTGAIYFIGSVIAIILYCYQAKNYEKIKNEANPDFYDFRNMKESIILAVIGIIGFLFSGIAGVGAGIILIPCCIIFPTFKMNISRAINTMILIQFLIDLCVFLQTFQNINSINFADKGFYIGIGFSSILITFLFHKNIDKEKAELNLIIIIICLFSIDCSLGIFQAITFKSPNQNASYFSISIDDCKEDCKYRE